MLKEVQSPPYRKESESRHPTPSGLRWLSWDNTAILDESGAIRELQGIGRDITGRKQAEAALRQNMDHLTALSQASQMVTGSLDLDQVLSQIVSLASQVVDSDNTSVVLVDETGRPVENLSGLPNVPTIDYRARKKGFTEWILRSHRPIVIDEIGPTGVVKPKVETGAPRTANPIMAANGIRSFAGLPLTIKDRVLGVLYLHSRKPGTFRDQLALLTTFANQAAIAIENARLYDAVQKELMERKQAEANLGESEARLSTIFRTSPVAIATSRLTDSHFTDFNDTFQNISGYSREALLGHSAYEIDLWVDPDKRRHLVAELKAIGAVRNYEFQLRRKSGEVLDMLMSAELINLSGETHVLTIAQDITERKRAEVAVQQQVNELQRWYDLTLDRETRSLELKHEVNQLLLRLNEPERYPSAEK
jgi:PAS domain S-box-containing protein